MTDNNFHNKLPHWLCLIRISIALLVLILISFPQWQYHLPRQGTGSAENWTWTPPSVYEWILVILVSVGGLTDIFDGKIARKNKTNSKLGGYFDLISDRISYIAIFIAWTVIGYLPNYLLPWWMLRQIIPTIFLFIASQLKHGKSSIGITYIRELLFYYVFFCNGQTRFMHANNLQKQLLWIPADIAMLLTWLLFFKYIYRQWPYIKQTLSLPSPGTIPPVLTKNDRGNYQELPKNMRSDCS